MPRPAGAREPADRGREAMAESTERDQVVGRRGVRRRVLEGPVVRLDGGLLAAHLTDTARTGEGIAISPDFTQVSSVSMGWGVTEYR